MASAALVVPSFAQHSPSTPKAEAHGPQGGTSTGSHSQALIGPFNLAVHGAFRRMVHARDFAPKVELKSVMHSGATIAVGAVSGLRGEITIIDGVTLVSYGAPCSPCTPANEETATLLASANVSSWGEPISLASDLTGAALDAFIVESATIAGLDMTKPFPVRLTGNLITVRMHVIKRPNPEFKGHGGGQPMADQESVAADKIDGEIVAFYAPASAQGIITHPGEPFHYHWVDVARTRTTHLDAFTVSKGSKLLLPRS